MRQKPGDKDCFNRVSAYSRRDTDRAVTSVRPSVCLSVTRWQDSTREISLLTERIAHISGADWRYIFKVIEGERKQYTVRQTTH